MKCAAVVCTYGRESLCELLACIDRQTLQLPVLLYIDDAPQLRVRNQPSAVHVVSGPASATFGAMRRQAMEWAREVLELDGDSGVLVLDDDDFYSSRHFEVTVSALERAPGGWTGGLAMGLTLDGSEPMYTRGESGVGQHATWGFRLARYDEAGGYPDVPKNEDLGLGYGMHWATCAPHWTCTHVRRQSIHGISGAADFDRPLLRRNPNVPTVSVAWPYWSEECERLEKWCATRPPG